MRYDLFSDKAEKKLYGGGGGIRKGLERSGNLLGKRTVFIQC